MSILDSEEVCVELLKDYASQDYVKEVLQISSDGSMVMWIHFYYLAAASLKYLPFHSFYYKTIFKITFPDIVYMEFRN